MDPIDRSRVARDPIERAPPAGDPIDRSRVARDPIEHAPPARDPIHHARSASHSANAASARPRWEIAFFCSVDISAIVVPLYSKIGS